MTHDDRLDLLRRAVAEAGSQAEVARRIGYKPPTISLVLAGKYPGEPETVLARVEEVYGDKTVPCPVLGEIALSRCADNRERAAAGLRVTNPRTMQLYAACRRCTVKGG